MNIHIEFTITPNDYAEFNLAYLKHRKALTPPEQRGLRSLNVLIWIPIFLFLGGYCIFSSFTTPSAPATAPASPTPLRDLCIALLPYFVAFLVIMLFAFWWPRSKFIYRRFATSAARVNETKIADILDDRIIIREHGRTTETQWPYFIRFVETPNTFLLFTVARVAEIIPKRAFTNPADILTFRNLATANIGNQPIGFPVQPPPPQR